MDGADQTPGLGLTPETYFGVGKRVNFGGAQTYDKGSANFTYPPTQPADTFALSGPWSLDYEGATPTATTPASNSTITPRTSTSSWAAPEPSR